MAPPKPPTTDESPNDQTAGNGTPSSWASRSKMMQEQRRLDAGESARSWITRPLLFLVTFLMGGFTAASSFNDPFNLIWGGIPLYFCYRKLKSVTARPIMWFCVLVSAAMILGILVTIILFGATIGKGRV